MRKPLVYCLDADPDFLQILEKRFLEYECDVSLFQSVPDLWVALLKQKPHLLLLGMPSSEVEPSCLLIRSLRMQSVFLGPLLVLSEGWIPERVVQVLEAGANDLVVKPPLRYSFEEVLAYYIRTPQLPEPFWGHFREVLPGKQGAQMRFRMQIQEVFDHGFWVLSDHLLRKEATFYLQGPAIQKITPHCSKILVRVVQSKTEWIGDQKKYRLLLEVNDSQTLAIEEMKSFLWKQLGDL